MGGLRQFLHIGASLLTFIGAACWHGIILADDVSPQSPTTVVIFYSYRTFMPVNADWDRGIRRGLENAGRSELRIDVEYLDLDRFTDDGYSQRLVDLLELKYADKPVKVVISVYRQAIQFVLEHRAKLFPKTPIVFCTGPRELQLDSVPNATGTEFEFDYLKTVQEAQRLFPRARTLYLIGGNGPVDLEYRRLAHEALQNAEATLKIVDVQGLPLTELKERIAHADRDGIALMLTYDRDNHENHLFTAAVTEQLSADCPIPLFGVYDTLIGKGIIGGFVVNVESHGEQAGAIAAQILGGQDTVEIPITGRNSNRLEFDARQLRRWGIHTGNLPKDSVTRFAEDSVWDRYRTQIGIGLSLVVAQTFIIAGLILNRTRRIKAERSLRASRSEARQLAGKLLSAQEDERTRIARELHDDLSQRLAALAIEMSKLEARISVSSVHHPTVHQVKDDLIALSEDVHHMSWQIHPSILDDLGLEDAIRSRCSRLAQRNAVEIQFRCGFVDEKIPKEIGLNLYRIVQEALWNAIKHASTTRIEVRLSSDPESVFAEVQDFGVGFDENAASSKQGLGLASMRERARLIDGTLTIRSSREIGTTISMTVPLPKDDQ